MAPCVRQGRDEKGEAPGEKLGLCEYTFFYSFDSATVMFQITKPNQKINQKEKKHAYTCRSS